MIDTLVGAVIAGLALGWLAHATFTHWRKAGRTLDHLIDKARIEALEKAARDEHSARVCAEWDRARAQLERDQAIARADSTGASWADALAQPGHLPTVRGPKDRYWVAAGDEPVLDQVRASHGLPTHQTVVRFPGGGESV